MSKRNGSTPKQLTPKDLLEYKLRLNAVNTAKHQFMMVEESYNNWLHQTLKVYRINGKVQIDLQTGYMEPVAGVAADGRPDNQAQAS